MENNDVIVIGGGTAGFLSAQMASRSGGRVTIVEKERLGGICPNWGCIPMCFMDHCVDVIRSVKAAGTCGINTGKLKLDYEALIKQKEKVVRGVVAGMEARLKTAGIPVVSGTARLLSPHRVEITHSGGKKEEVDAGGVIIAAGSTARRYDVPGAFGPGVLTTRELLDLEELPASLAVIGRSVTALELAAVWANLGSRVSLIARKPRLLPNEDEEIAAYIGQALEAEGVRLYAGYEVERIDGGAAGKSVTITGEGGKQTVEAQFVAFALGQQPLVDGLGLENAGIKASEGSIETNEKMETGVKGLYAAGDVTGRVMLASTAMIQGMAAGTNAAGGSMAVDYRVVPRSIRTVPPVAAVGITEGEAKEQGLDIKVGRFPFGQNPKATMTQQGDGFVKIVAGSASGEILGVHIVGPQAPELIHEAAAFIRMKGTFGDMAAMIHGHPSLHETMQRAAQMTGN